MVIVAQPVVHLIVLNRHFRHQEVRNPKERENTYVVLGRIQVQEGEFQDDPVALSLWRIFKVVAIASAIVVILCQLAAP